MSSQSHSSSSPEPFEPSVTPLTESPFEPYSSEQESIIAEERDGTVSDLSGHVTKGASWTLVSAIFTQMVSLARTTALARLLSRGDFGLVAMALTVISGLYTLTNTGVSSSVISTPFKRKDELYAYTNTVWTMEAARGGIVAVLLAVTALPVALFYRDERLTPILLALSLTPILGALANIGLMLQARRMEFGRTTLHSIITNFLTVSLTIALAWWTRNYWALVGGQIIGAVVGVGLSYIFSSYRPRFNIDWDNARRAFNFGKHIFIIGIANYILTVMDNVLVGRLLGATALGTYVIAYAFCNLPRAFINNVFSSILFPMFASVNREGDLERTNLILERAVTLACAVLLAIITPLVIFAPAVVRVLYGTKWESAVGPMRILLLAGFFASLLVLLSTFMVGINRPNIESRAKIFDAVLFLCLVYPFTLWLGIVGAALGSCLTSLISLLYRWRAIAPIAPLACRRLPWIMGSALLCFAVIAQAAILLITLLSSGADLASFHPVTTLLHQTLPLTGAAWAQLLLGLPTLALLSLGCFMFVQPMARGEVSSAFGKLRGYLPGRSA